MPCGFDSLTNEATTRLTIHGLSFNVMVIGKTGIGKTTLINSLFDFDYGDSTDHERESNGVKLRIKEFKPQNKTIEMKMTIIETKHFGNGADKTNDCKPIADYVTARFNDHLKDELGPRDTLYNNIQDNRVHCCIYMISFLGLSALDLVSMKQLHKRVCLIPVIAKADTLSREERKILKEKVRQQIIDNNIEVYGSSEYDLPLAIAASNDIVTENGKRQRVRTYHWGTMYIERDSEFTKLRDLVLRSEMLSMIEYNNKINYDEYRKEVARRDKEFYKVISTFEYAKSKLLDEIDDLEGDSKPRPAERRNTGDGDRLAYDRYSPTKFRSTQMHTTPKRM